MGFYQEMMLQLEARAKAVKLSGDPDTASLEIESIFRCIHRCLLYLGDLARYMELYSDSETKDFSNAEKYYERAAIQEPSSGNAQNQMAVLATYSDSECTAVYRYCRSILVKQPFLGGDFMTIGFTLIMTI